MFSVLAAVKSLRTTCCSRHPFTQKILERAEEDDVTAHDVEM